MAGTNLLTLIDDIATILDDVAAMTKVATKKTAGVLGDDLALNAQQVAGVKADRELPVVLAVAKGALKNKLILAPAALAVSALIPWLVTPLLMAGGVFLCFEGFEKLAHKVMRGKAEDKTHRENLVNALVDPAVDMVAFERDKIRGAVRTDFILSAEIIVIALGTVAAEPFGMRVAVLLGITLIMTGGVYGLVAGIVKLDDGGLYLSQKRGADLPSKIARGAGAAVLRGAPYLMKSLSIAGMAAMFVVGGSILAHGIPGAEDLVHALTRRAGAVPGIGRLLAAVAPTLLDALAGFLAGAAALAVVGGGRLVERAIKSKRDQSVGRKRRGREDTKGQTSRS